MKIAISATGKDINSQIDPRLGRCAYFMIVQTDDMSVEVFENEYKSLGGGAGIQSATFLNSKDVKTVLTGNCGPNAMNVFSECKIKVVTGQAGSIKDIVEKFKKGELTPLVNTAISEKDGVTGETVQGGNRSQGPGRCTGRGGGRGMGGGGGRGMGGGGGRGMGGGQGTDGGMGRGKA